MKFTLSWLKEHLETSAALDEICARLTMLGLEVEEVVDRAQDLAAFKVARVVTVEPHPNADRLRLCTVETGSGTIRVVCGAPNVRAGMKAVLACPGDTIPASGTVLKKSAIRGVESDGMLCSASELLTGDDEEGIIELPADAKVGEPFAGALGLDDPVIDVAVTPNRSDCLGVRGVARDLAAAGVGSLVPRADAPVPASFKCPVNVRLDFAPSVRPAPCAMFAGRVIRGVINRPSPQWLQNRLKAIGLRPISSLVDITNYLTIDRARPLHVFDADCLAGNLTVRLAERGQKLMALNGKEYELDPDMTVIADEDGVLSLGGVIGGEPSGCTPATQSVFLECALFDPVRTAATGRKLGVESDARYRFERGVDPASVLPGIEAATRMIVELCGGEASEVVVAGAEPDWRRSIALRPSRVHHLGGVDLPEDRSRGILEKLGFEVRPAEGALDATAPSWRTDIEIEADLVEEILRINGYDDIPPASLPRETALPKGALTVLQQRAAAARRMLAARGMVETVTWSFVAETDARRFGGIDERLRLVNPISADLAVMRSSVLPNLIAAAARNADRGLRDAVLFEIGPAYAGDRPEDQALVAAGVRMGASNPRHWAAAPRPVDAFDAKADILAAAAAAGLASDALSVEQGGPAWYHPGRCGTLLFRPKTVLGHFGEIHPAVLADMDVVGPVAAFEFFLGAVPEPRRKAGRAKPPFKASPFQPVERDFAFVVDASVPADAIVRAAKSADRELIAHVAVFDLYAGAGVGEGRKSLAVTVRLQPYDKTLTDTEIENVASRIVANVEKATGGSLRS